MSKIDEFDVVIAGAGMAGVAVAAALGEFGYRVAVLEPKMDAPSRLAGELIHPAGLQALDQLGLLATFQDGPALPIAGFSIYFGASAHARTVRLPYTSAPENGRSALALEHGLIRQRSISAVSRLPWVALFPARITDLDLSWKDRVNVTVLSHDGERRMRCRLLVGAAGGSSNLSKLAGLVQTRRRISTLVGLLVKDIRLPDPGYSHVFLGGSGPVLAYQISDSSTRIILDVPGTADRTAIIQTCRTNLAALPECIRKQVRTAIETQLPIASASYWASARVITRGRLLLVGDSAGCCHPITATGLTVCARDALLLRDALRDVDGDIPRALVLHAKRRRAQERTRVALAQALYEVFCGQTPEVRLIRDGMYDYLRRSGKGRSVSIALLSTSEDRIQVMLRELARVILYGLGARVSEVACEGKLSLVSQSPVLLGLLWTVLRHVIEVLRTT